MGRENNREGHGNNREGRGGCSQSGRGCGRGRYDHRESKGYKEPENKFNPYGAWTGKKTATFETVKQHLIEYVQRTYKYGQDVAISLREMELIDMNEKRPTMYSSESTDPDERQLENEGLKISYQAEVTRFIERRDLLEQNMFKTYSLIMSTYCTSLMRSRIESHAEFDDLKDDPIRLLQVIQVLMHDTVRGQYPYASVTDTFKKLLYLKQQENEPLLDYVKRFKEAKDVFRAHCGTRVLDFFVETTREYREEEDDEYKEEIKHEAFGSWTAYMMIKNADQAKYGGLINQMATQYAMGLNQFPSELQRAVDILSTYKVDYGKGYAKKKWEPRAKKDEEDKVKKETSFAQKKDSSSKTVTCYCCGKKGHVSPDCPEKDSRKKADWAFKKEKNFNQDKADVSEVASNVDDSEDDNSYRSGKKQGWSCMQLSLMNEETNNSRMKSRMKDSIILDNGSTLSIFGNPELVSNIRKSDVTLQLATNAGTQESNQVAEVPGYGQVWYDSRAIANIFGLSDLKNKYRVTYDSEKGDSFVVYMDGKEIYFKCNEDGLYEYKVSGAYKDEIQEKKKQESSYMIETVEENRQGFTTRQFQRAKQARELYHNVGSPTVDNFKALLKMNFIKNCPVTVEDVKVAERIFGPALSTLKGKSTRKTPKPVIRDEIEIPSEIKDLNKEVDLCMDTIFINECPMLTTIDKSIRFRALVPLENRTHEQYYKALDQVLRFYNKGGFKVRTIFCDGEFCPMMERVSDDLDVVMNYTNAQDHVPEAERNNRTIKERVRAAFHRLPFKKIPRVMIRYLAMVQVNHLNLFPAKGGVSKYYSPKMILTSEVLDYNKHFQVSFGQYVQVNHESDKKNSNVARTLDAIYLRPNKNLQGGHEVMDLASGRVITRSVVKPIPMSQMIIDTVERMADDQGFKELKFKNKYGNIYPDVDVAGVDDDTDEYEDNEDDEFEYDDDYLPDDEEEVDEDEEDEIVFGDVIDPQEAEELLFDDTINDMWQQPRPIEREVEEEKQEEEAEEEEKNDEQQQQEAEEQKEEPERNLRRSTRVRRPVDRLSPRWTGQSYLEGILKKGGILKKAKKHYQEGEKLKRVKRVHFKEDEERKMELSHNILHQVNPTQEQMKEYEVEDAIVIARLIGDLNSTMSIKGLSFAQQYLLKQGLKKFEKRGEEAARKELDQLCKRNCFMPVGVKELTPSERKRAQSSLMFLNEKRDGTVKGRLVYDGRRTRDWLTREEAMSPTAALESIFLTAVIEAKEERDIMTCDIPNAFIQAEMPSIKDGQERVIMKITGVLVGLLTEINPNLFGPKVVFENGRHVIYVWVLKAIYGMVEAALLWYKKLRKQLETVGFVFNPYDPCVANREVRGQQHTIVFHVDDLKSSHKEGKTNDEFLNWLNSKFGEFGAVTAKRGRVHDYLGMILDYSSKGKVIVNMTKYVEDLINGFPIKFKKEQVALTPAGEKLFEIGQGKRLEDKRREIFHSTVAKGLFLAKRGRPDIQQTIALLCTRVREPNESDWNKLIRMMKYLNGSKDKVLTLGADNLRVIKWLIDASFGVHPDFKSHTGAVMTMGKGAIQSISRKQKLNTRSSTESELVGVDDVCTMVLWTKLFLEAQGYQVDKNIIYQDNKSAILLETNGKKSAGKRSRALNVRYFFVTDQVEKGNLQVEYCPTNEMLGDFFTKPLQGTKFLKFRGQILGEDNGGEK